MRIRKLKWLSTRCDMCKLSSLKNIRCILRTYVHLQTLDLPHKEVKFLSSPELKAQVSFSDRCCPPVRPSVCRSVCKHFTFSSTSLEAIGQCHPNSHNALLGKGDSSLFKWRATCFPQERYLGNSKNKVTTFKDLLQSHWDLFQPNLAPS